MASKKELESRIEALERAIKQGTKSHAQPSAFESSSTSRNVWDIEIPFELDIQVECKSCTDRDNSCC